MGRKKRKSWRSQKPSEGRLYYSIGEVARQFGVEEHILRYWEEVTPLSPERSPSSDARMYRQEDLEMIGRIKHLVVDKGLTPAVASLLLNIDDVKTHLEVREKLVEVRERLTDMCEMVKEAKEDWV